MIEYQTLVNRQTEDGYSVFILTWLCPTVSITAPLRYPQDVVVSA